MRMDPRARWKATLPLILWLQWTSHWASAEPHADPKHTGSSKPSPGCATADSKAERQRCQTEVLQVCQSGYDETGDAAAAVSCLTEYVRLGPFRTEPQEVGKCLDVEMRRPAQELGCLSLPEQTDQELVAKADCFDAQSVYLLPECGSRGGPCRKCVGQNAYNCTVVRHCGVIALDSQLGQIEVKIGVEPEKARIVAAARVPRQRLSQVEDLCRSVARVDEVLSAIRTMELRMKELKGPALQPWIDGRKKLEDGLPLIRQMVGSELGGYELRWKRKFNRAADCKLTP